jgi:hypothetical protein
MNRSVARRFALVTIAVVSVLWALFLIFSVTGRDQINGFTTPHLLAILALLLLPGATWLVWRLERRVSLQVPRVNRSSQRATGVPGAGRPCRSATNPPISSGNKPG